MGNITSIKWRGIYQIKKGGGKNSNNSRSSSVIYSTNADESSLIDDNNQKDYIMKITLQQVDRFQQQHHVYRILWDGNYSSPVGDILKSGGANVLDVGCGPGTWICDMASEYQQSNFFGVDINELFPKIQPRNVFFKKTDVFSGLPFKDDFFDLVRISRMVFCFSEQQWDTFIVPELVRVIKPGGWIELEDSEVVMYNRGPAATIISDAVNQILKSKSMDPNITKRFPQFMNSTERLGDIYHQEKNIPCGSWGGLLGGLIGEFTDSFYDGIKRKIMDILNCSESQVDKLLSDYANERSLYRTYSKQHRYYAQKLLK